MSIDAMQPVERRALRDGVHERILEMLMDGSLAPGDPLSIDGIARGLHVSPTPVREAFSHMEHTGLVMRTALKGYRVAPALTPTQMHQLVDAREIVEIGALERAWDRLDDLIVDLKVAHAHHIQVLAGIEREGHGLIKGTAAFREHFEADWGFHLTIIMHTDNPFIAQMAEGLGSHVHRLHQSYHQGDSDAHDAVEEHARVLEAIEARSITLARAAMLAHLNGVRLRTTGDDSRA
ncbi:MAG: GntR family transcriptional regulator [Propionibacteriaceae bacterium]